MLHEHRPRIEEGGEPEEGVERHAGATLEEDRDREHVAASARLGRPTAALLVPIALTIGVILFGLLGSRLSSPAPSAPPAPDRPTEQVAVASATPAPPAPRPPLSIAAPDPLLPGFFALNPIATTTQVLLASDVSSGSFATSGRVLFYVAGGSRIESIALVPGSAPVRVAQVQDCEWIDQLAMAGQSLVYVVERPIGGVTTDYGCGASTELAWTIRRLDPAAHADWVLAQGTHVQSPTRPDELPVHVAATATAYAFERDVTDGRPGASIEVHSFDGKTTWTAAVDGRVRSLMLGGDRLAVLTDAPGKPLEVADSTDRTLRTIAYPMSAASLSPDGAYVAWDAVSGGDPRRVSIVVQGLHGRTASRIATLATGASDASRPIVSAQVFGPEVAWLATLSDGSIAPAFVDPVHPDGGLFESAQVPAWIGFSGDDLVWVIANAVGGPPEAFVADLPSLPAGPAGPP